MPEMGLAPFCGFPAGLCLCAVCEQLLVAFCHLRGRPCREPRRLPRAIVDPPFQPFTFVLVAAGRHGQRRLSETTSPPGLPSPFPVMIAPTRSVAAGTVVKQVRVPAVVPG